VNVALVFKKGKKEDSGNYRLVSLISVPRKVMQQILLEPISRHTNDQKVTGNSQHGFTKEKQKKNKTQHTTQQKTARFSLWYVAAPGEVQIGH